MMAHGPAAGPSMDRRTVLGIGGALALAVLSACTTPEHAPAPAATSAGTGGSLTVKATGLDTPWSMARTKNGRTLISERDNARILALAPDGTITPLVHLPQVVSGGEAGLLGLEVIAIGTREWLYAYLGTEADNRVVRLELQDSGLGPVEDILTGIPRANIHNGGRIKQGPDSLLYIGTGDATDQPAAQDTNQLNGKILRITPDGAIPSSNPFAGSPVYSYGHRNVQGLAWDSGDRLWASELGPEKDDEVNLIEAGKNYGWPFVTGAVRDTRFTDPVHVWPSTAEASPSALAIAGDIAYAACLRGERLWELPLPAGDPQSSGTIAEARALLTGQEGRLRDALVVGNDLWIATNEGAASRIIALPLPLA